MLTILALLSLPFHTANKAYCSSWPSKIKILQVNEMASITTSALQLVSRVLGERLAVAISLCNGFNYGSI